MRKTLILLIAIIAVLTAGLYLSINRKEMGSKPTAPSHPIYSLRIASGSSYPSNKATELSFDVRDQKDKVIKDFDVAHEKKMHFIIIRKDRTNFQHVHPTLDENTGMFTLDSFTFPTDGEYRVYADFTLSQTEKDANGEKPPTTLYQDVRVGDFTKYRPQTFDSDSLASTSNGLEAKFFVTAHDGGIVGNKFSAGNSSTIAIQLNKHGQSFTKLEQYLGALGHMVVIGPDLEFIHAHAKDQDINNQTGLLVFEVNFPKAGQYRLFLQTQAETQVATFDFALSVQPGSSEPMPDQTNMDHNGH